VTEPRTTSCCVAIGPELVSYAIDEERLTLTRIGAASAPEAVQYAWTHPVLPLVYVAYSNRATANDSHGVAVFQIDRSTRLLNDLGQRVVLDNRPIHLSVDPAGRHLLVGFNQPSGLDVHKLNPDGSIGGRVNQGQPVDAGIFAHQVRTSPSGDLVVLSTRGNNATAQRAEDPGALKVFRFADGQLSDETSIAPGDGIGFGPRHVDFHPTGPWMYAVLERSNEVLAYEVRPDGVRASPIAAEPTADRADRRAPQQYAGAVHVHPNGKHLYVANRSDGTVEVRGKPVHSQGENSVAVFSIDSLTGALKRIQTIDIGAFHARTFAIHPGGKILVTAAIKPLAEWDGERIRDVPAGLSIFRIGDDGLLTLVRQHHIDAGPHLVFWCGMVSS
jgi:6-phosphogluconolactonase (cycloisomerase 2 family)